MFTNSQIDIESLPKVEDLNFQPIEKSYFKIILFNLFITYGSITGGLFILKFLIDKDKFQNIFWYLIPLLLVSFFIQLMVYKLGFKTRQYALREKDITYSSGYIVNSTTTLPYNRIQHIEISRSFIARKLGLSTLKIYSAGESGGDLSIKGLSKEVADTQYAFLTSLLNDCV